MLILLMLTSLPAVVLVFFLGYRTGLLSRIDIEPNRPAPAAGTPSWVTRAHHGEDQ